MLNTDHLIIQFRFSLKYSKYNTLKYSVPSAKFFVRLPMTLSSVLKKIFKNHIIYKVKKI